MQTTSSVETAAYPVVLYQYDISLGMGPKLGLGRIWHTSIVVHGHEFMFGKSAGIVICKKPGKPTTVMELGSTSITFDQIRLYLDLLSKTNYSKETYNIKTHNCNNFSNTVSEFLCGVSIPCDILMMPEEVERKVNKVTTSATSSLPQGFDLVSAVTSAVFSLGSFLTPKTYNASSEHEKRKK